MTVILQDVYTRMAEKAQALPVVSPPVFDAMNFLALAERRLGNVYQDNFAAVYMLCSAIAENHVSSAALEDHARGLPNSRSKDVKEHAVKVYADVASRHAYEGTVFIALVEEVEAKVGHIALREVHRALRARRAADPASWALARNYGRPSVPPEMLPVFAVHAAEVRLGRPLASLTEAQLTALGLR